MCRSPREDFTSQDSPLFPMYIHQGGELYGFCPGKATWNSGLVGYFQELVTIAEIGVLPVAGGLNDQDDDLIEELSWFLPAYDLMKFTRKADMILKGEDIPGDVKKILPGPHRTTKGPAKRPARR